MRRKCDSCLCGTCLDVCCDRRNCEGKKEICENYRGFWQESAFAAQREPQRPKTPRHSLGHYGLTDERVRELESLIRSGGAYADMASQAAHMANEAIAESILLSVMENKSYDALSVKWDLGETERMPYGKTDFYGIRRYFFSIFDKELRRRESDGSRGSETDKSEGLKV